MKKINVRNAIFGSAITLIVGVLAFAGLNYLFIPRIGWSAGLLITIALSVGIGLGAGAIYSAITWEYDESSFPVGRNIVLGAIIVLIVLAMIVSWIVSWRCFHVDEVKARLHMETVSEEEFIEMLPSVDTKGAYSLVDSDTARKLASRKMGEMNELVNLFTTSNIVSTAISDGEVIKYVPLEYGGLLKSGKSEFIPGYITVDPSAQSANYVEAHFVYSPSAYFSKDLMRHLRNCMPNEYFGNRFFQVSPEGVPSWVVELEKTCGSWIVREVYAVAIVDAVTGECVKYELDDVPEWVTSVYGDTAVEYYNSYSDYIKGWFNPSKDGETTTTDDFGYVAIDGDLYYYTGITSKILDGGDESNLGVMLYNAHDNNAFYCDLAGAEEYSAMEEAEGVVQNFGYKASFPSLIDVGGELTYVMVLKSNNGVVKQYGMVNYADYTIAVTADTLEQCKVAYAKALSDGGKISSDAIANNLISVCVDVVEYITLGGETIVYIRDNENNVYKSAFDERFLFVETGDTLVLNVIDAESEIQSAIFERFEKVVQQPAAIEVS